MVKATDPYGEPNAVTAVPEPSDVVIVTIDDQERERSSDDKR